MRMLGAIEFLSSTPCYRRRYPNKDTKGRLRHSGWQRPYCDEVSARPPPRHGDDPCLPVGRTA
jgi:hypothetical protein